MLLDRFPVDSTELIYLVDKLFDGCTINFAIVIRTINFQLYWERISVKCTMSAIFISGIIAEKIGSLTKIDVTPAIWHKLVAFCIKENLVF